MSSIVISPKNQKELQFISKLLKKLGVKNKVLSDEDLEDAGLSVLLKQANRSEIVSEDDVMAKLRSQ